MTTKERILALLEENRGTPLSGEVLAEELGVSRTAVWKAIKDLQKAGHAIAAGAVLVTNNTREFARVPGLILEDWVN